MYTANVCKYDGRQGSWTQCPPLHTARVHSGITSAAGSIKCERFSGGCIGVYSLNAVYQATILLPFYVETQKNSYSLSHLYIDPET